LIDGSIRLISNLISALNSAVTSFDFGSPFACFLVGLRYAFEWVLFRFLSLLASFSFDVGSGFAGFLFRFMSPRHRADKLISPVIDVRASPKSGIPDWT
jgi:hypothetical protein